MRIEPRPSLPCAIGTSPAATAAAEPPEEPPGRTVQVPRVAGRRRSSSSVTRPQAQLGHPGHADDDRAGAAQPAYHLVVVLGDGRAGRRRAVPGRQAGDRGVLLDRHRHAGQRQVGQVLLLVDLLRLGDRLAAAHGPERGQRRVG